MSSLYLRARNSGLCPPSILLEECSKFDSLDGFEAAMNKVIDDNGFCLRPGQDVAKDLKEVLESKINGSRLDINGKPRLSMRYLPSCWMLTKATHMELDILSNQSGVRHIVCVGRRRWFTDLGDAASRLSEDNTTLKLNIMQFAITECRCYRLLLVTVRVHISDSSVGLADPNFKKRIIDYRRCIVLAIVGCTPIESNSLASVVLDGYLSSVKVWLVDILSPPLGSVDMLLHLLVNITNLPVTKAAIKDSGMGKTIGTIGKHEICKDTPNERAIEEKLNVLKDSWNSYVKARKAIEVGNDAVKVSPPSDTTKREAPDTASSNSPAKRQKMDKEAKVGMGQKMDNEPKKTSIFNSLIKTVKSGSPNGFGASSKLDSKPKESVMVQNPARTVFSNVKEDRSSTMSSKQDNMKQDSISKKSGLRVKWADHFGGQLSMTQEVEGEVVEKLTVQEAVVSWSDRKRRDRLREKELLTKAKSSKLLDDEDIISPANMKASQPWVAPLLLPERTNIVQPILNSAEYSVQESRISSIAQVRYSTDFDVPLSPDPLNDVEQALDMTSQASAVVTPIPFFAPQLVLPSSASTESYAEAPAVEHIATMPSTVPAKNDKASFEFVQSLGLPFYLVGQPVEVIQTLAGNPSLLNTLLDSNGIYDQQKLMSLVQTMSSQGALSNPAVSYQSTPNSTYGMPFNANSYGDSAPLAVQSVRTITRKSDDGNLHVSGYGPGTTEGDLIAAFSPYVRVDEVVLKGTFAFVNTSDHVNAQRAREALTGTLLNGMPIRINNATRKVRDNTPMLSATIPPPPALPPFSQPRQSTFGSQVSTAISPAVPPFSHPSFGAIHPNIDSVRDDKGNAPTKNLFVAGYGQGTNEQMLRDLFGQFAVVTGVVSKGTFAFVNTSDRHGAVVARENLGGTMFNGGILRINFAKETGRLGTSFDLTYGRLPGQNGNQLAGTTARQTNIGYYG